MISLLVTVRPMLASRVLTSGASAFTVTVSDIAPICRTGLTRALRSISSTTPFCSNFLNSCAVTSTRYDPRGRNVKE